MSFPDIVGEIRALAPDLRGRLSANAPLAEATWFRVGGPAQALFSPADEEDLAYLLGALPPDVPVTTIGLGSNLIVRDGGIGGVVVRLGGRAFNAIEVADGCRVVAGAAAPDQFVAKAAAAAGVDGLAFLRGVPGSIGGALRMNAGAHGGEIKDVLVEARGVDRSGARRAFSNAEMGFSYRHSSVPDDVIFTRRESSGPPGRTRRDRGGDGANHPRARRIAADPREDRRLDLQESRPARKPGGSSTRLAAGGLRSATPRSRPCIATSSSTAAARPPPTSRRSAKRSGGACARRAVFSSNGRSSASAWRHG